MDKLPAATRLALEEALLLQVNRRLCEKGVIPPDVCGSVAAQITQKKTSGEVQTKWM
ncbi:MAG: hypothetical protein RRY95_07400 [Oscillospiraceae bacterium]